MRDERVHPNALFYALGHTGVRHPRATLGAWALVLLLGVLFAPRLQEVFDREFVTGNAGEAQEAADLVSSRSCGWCWCPR